MGEVQQKVMCDEMETIKGFHDRGDKLNASRECEAAIITRTRVGWEKFRVWCDTVQKNILSIDERKGI